MKYTIDDFAHLLDHTNLCANETSEVQSKFCARNYREMKCLLLPNLMTELM